MNAFLVFVLLALMAAVAVAVLHLRSLFAAVMLFGIFSLLSATLFVVSDAVDVAFTEAAVGAGIATVLMLATLTLTGAVETPHRHPLRHALIVVATGLALLYGTLDMPRYADPNAPPHTHVAPRYIERGQAETGAPNLVTAVLASYRGYDTLGEVVVIFTAGVGVMALLGGGGFLRAARRSRSRPKPPSKLNTQLRGGVDGAS